MWFLVAFMDAVPGPGTFIVFVCLFKHLSSPPQPAHRWLLAFPRTPAQFPEILRIFSTVKEINNEPRVSRCSVEHCPLLQAGASTSHDDVTQSCC